MDQPLAQHYLEDALSSFRAYKKLATKALDQLNDEDYFVTLDQESNSIAVIMKHIAGNMILLYFLGRILEPGIGTPRFVALYVASLFAGSLGATLLSPDTLTIGASGAVFGSGEQAHNSNPIARAVHTGATARGTLTSLRLP